MSNGRFNKIFSSRTFYIVFAILASVVLWLYVDFIDNPDVEQLVSDIPIEFVNAELVADRRLAVTSVSPATVSLRFSGKRGDVYELDRTTVHVTVDLAQVTSPGQNKLDYKVNYAESANTKGISILTRSVDYVTVTVEKLSEKTLPLSGSYTAGNIAMEGYLAEAMAFSPETVTVSGPASALERIESAVVYVQRENLTKTTVEELPFILLDADGEAVDTEGLAFSRDTVTVTIPIKMVKEVSLTVKPIYGAGATEDNTTVDVSPKTITISGEADVMEGVNTILLATVDLTEFEFPYAYNFPIPLPNGTANLTGTADAVVTISVLGLESVHLSTPNIQIANVTDGYEATLITQSLDVVIRGKKADIDRLTAENIRVVADLSDLGETTGTYFVTAKALVDGDFGDVGAIGKYKVTVTLRERPPEPAMAGSP